MRRKFHQNQISFIQKSVAKLPDIEKKVVMLHFWESFSFSEMAIAYDVPIYLIKKVHNQALHRLRLNYLTEFVLPRIRRGLM